MGRVTCPNLRRELFSTLSEIHPWPDRFGNCQRPVFSLGVSQHMHQILPKKVARKCLLKKKTLLHKFYCFQMPEKGFKFKVFLRLKYFSEKLPISSKMRYSRGSRFSQCFILSRALHCLFLMPIYWYIFRAVNVDRMELLETTKLMSVSIFYQADIEYSNFR